MVYDTWLFGIGENVTLYIRNAFVNVHKCDRRYWLTTDNERVGTSTANIISISEMVGSINRHHTLSGKPLLLNS